MFIAWRGDNVSPVLWKCSACISTRGSFIKKLQELLDDSKSLQNVE